MLNAAEAAMEETAEDESERKRNRMQLYAPPKGGVPAPRGSGPAGRVGMSLAAAEALSARLAAEEAGPGVTAG